jgi:excisionase family DNA binding protein
MNNNETNIPLLLTPRQAAKSLSICEKTLYSLTKKGELQAVRIGRAVRYSIEDLNRWIKKSLENS